MTDFNEIYDYCKEQFEARKKVQSDWLYIKDLTDGEVRPYGSNQHDSLMIYDGQLRYYNLQNGDGSPTGYAFCDSEGNLTSRNEYAFEHYCIGRLRSDKDD